MVKRFTLTTHWISIIEVLRRLAKNQDDREGLAKLPTDPASPLANASPWR